MKHKINITQTLRHLLQVAAFVFFSGLFLSIFTALKDVVVSLITGTFSITGLAGQLILLAIAVLFTILWGRFFCGYLCAFGSVQELISWVFGHLFPRSRKVHPQFDRVMKYFKYAVLLAIVVLVWILQLPVDSSLSPWGVFGMLISGNLSVMSAAVPTLGFALLMAILIGSVFVERFFCRYLCPLGALFTLISGQRFFKIRRKESVCSGCRLCSRNCAMGVSVHDRPVVESGECIECMRCIGVCAPEALTANLNPAVAGTAAALMMCGLISVGNLTVDNTTVYAGEEQALSSIIELADKDTLAVETTEEKAGPFTDGVYTGRGDGFRGDVQVQVTVENGLISDITVLSAQDDAQYFNRAVSGIVAAILEQQSPNVDVVSGATFSSRGIMEAVADALSVDFDSSAVETAETSSDSAAIAVDEVPAASAEPVAETEEQYDEAIEESSAYGFTNGTFTGSGTGFRGATQVQVTVENGAIAGITILSFSDDTPYFNRALSVIDSIIANQSVQVATVGGATFSSNGILEAVADAIGIGFTNPNGSMSTGHGGPQKH